MLTLERKGGGEFIAVDREGRLGGGSHTAGL